jgi:hypothetical protein
MRFIPAPLAGVLGCGTVMAPAMAAAQLTGADSTFD